MKKLLAGLTVVACVFIASSAMAAGLKVPKLLCINYGNENHQLSFKASGKIQDGDQKVTTYEITGRDTNGPIHGTAYARDDYNLYATYTGMTAGLTNYVVRTYFLSFSPTFNSGTIQYRLDYATNVQTTGETTVTGIDCTTLSFN